MSKKADLTKDISENPKMAPESGTKDLPLDYESYEGIIADGLSQLDKGNAHVEIISTVLVNSKLLIFCAVCLALCGATALLPRSGIPEKSANAIARATFGHQYNLLKWAKQSPSVNSR